MLMLTNGGDYAIDFGGVQQLFAKPVIEHRPASIHQLSQSLLANCETARHCHRVSAVDIAPADGGPVLLWQGSYGLFHQYRIKRIDGRLNHWCVPLPGLALVHAEHRGNLPAMRANDHPPAPVLQPRMNGLVAVFDVVVIDDLSYAHQHASLSVCDLCNGAIDGLQLVHAA